jgi:hypothetical protein
MLQIVMLEIVWCIVVLGLIDLYQVPEVLTLWRFSNQLYCDSPWRTKEVRHAYCLAP